MATDSNKALVGVGIGAALLGVLAALGGGKKKTPTLQGPKTGCNCGR